MDSNPLKIRACHPASTDFAGRIRRVRQPFTPLLLAQYARIMEF